MDKVLMSPILLSPGRRRITVFGGGKVALRKCRHFEGFRIKVVSLEILPELRETAQETVVKNIDRETVVEEIGNADIVIAATDDRGLNDMIRDVSMSCGKMTNSAHGGGDVLIPSTLRRPGYTVSVSSEGRVPAFPPYVLSKIDNLLDPSYDAMLELLMDLRALIRDVIPTQEGRAGFLASVLADEAVWKLLEEGDMASAYRLSVEKGDLA